MILTSATIHLTLKGTALESIDYLDQALFISLVSERLPVPSLLLESVWASLPRI
jgi:hypothetical protein